MRVKFHVNPQRLAIFALVAFLILLLRFWPHAPLSSIAPSSTAILAADGRLLRLTLAQDDQYRLWVPLDNISPQIQQAVMLQEDQWFYWHIGVNPVSIIRGAMETYSGNSRQGGSTLTMQLVRLIYKLNTRSAWGKIKQIGLAIWVELRYSKQDILEAYLNLAPYGYNIQGIPAASLIYFGKTADKLTLSEVMSLAVIPQKPNQRGKYNASLQNARLRLFKRWQSHYPVSATDAQLMQMPLPLKRIQELPFEAPHFSEQLIRKEANTLTHQIQSSLQPKLQRLLERQISAFISQHQTRGVHNASAMMVDTRTQKVVAMVGSADYHNITISGQVNGTLAKRSPGSTLKPFIYGLAYDQGIIHPRSILRDAPTAFGPFQPENFDGRFVGPITAHEALIRSRNIPAVDVASRLKNPSLYTFLKTAGISKLRSEEHYGLALVLGGGEVTMEELATLYTMLANQGQLKPLSYEQATLPQTGVALLSPEASYMVWDSLRDNPRPDSISAASKHGWDVAWKTGTSWGFRDAWTAGIVGHYVLIVWVGNFDSSSNPAFVGIETAAPLFFRIADALPIISANEALSTRIPPVNLKRIKVCTASGQLPNQWCPQQSSTWFIPGKSPIQVSTLHQPVMIDNRTGRAACPPYDINGTHQEVFEFWDSSMLRLFREAGMPRRVPPQANCDNAGVVTDAENAPKITSPLKSVSYQLRLSRPDETIALQATAGGDAELLYWFSGKQFLGSTPSKGAGLPWRPAEAGWHSITVVDDKARSHSRDVKVEIMP
jgi:penicillin-binding protein 1C